MVLQAKNDHRTTFGVDDWITHTPKSILAKNFGVNESLFDTVPTPDPYIVKGEVEDSTVTSPYGKLEGNSSYVYKLSQKTIPPAPGGGGTLAIVDSRNFPIAKTLAAAIVTLEPGGLRELHWHPNVGPRSFSFILLIRCYVCMNPLSLPKAEEWLYFHRGQARATVFLGGAIARTFDFYAGDTAVFPDNSGNVSPPNRFSLRVRLSFTSTNFSRCRPLHRKHLSHRKTGVDRNVQKRSRGRHQLDPVAGPNPGPHRGHDAEYLLVRRETVEKGKANSD